MDWAAGILEIAGMWLVGSRRRHGFLLCLGCNLMWVGVALQSRVYGLIPVSVVMMAVNLRNYNRWRSR